MRDLADELLQAKVKARLFGGDHAPRLGRLVVLDRIGAGAMGTVYAAYDPRLDRKVAVKIMHVADEDANARFLRECRALARLAHPNIVTIHDAGDDTGCVHVVMELATGVPLRVWIDNPERSWRDVVRVLAEVAAGLAAAHRANIVHRDIKPDNILVGEDRARLIDFGLALEPASLVTPPPTAEPIGVAPKPTARDLALLDTQEPMAASDRSNTSPFAATAAVSIDDRAAGTPSYMAPEVLAGGAATAASDQFSFAVTLFEALYGERPYSGTTRAELRKAALHAADAVRSARSSISAPPPRDKPQPSAEPTAPFGDQTVVSAPSPARVRRAPAVERVPQWIDAILKRALAPDPANRFPSMEALEAELRRDRRRRQRVLAVIAGALIAGGAIGAVASRAGGDTRVVVPEAVSCDGRSRVELLWNSPVEDDVRHRLGDVPWATSTIDSLRGAAGAWEGSFRSVCEATRVRGEQSDRLLELRVRCLDRALDRLGALAEALAAPLDSAGRVEAPSSVAMLPAPKLCETLIESPELALPADPTERAEATSIERDLDHAWAAYALGRYAAARTRAISLSQRAEKLHLPALQAAVLLLGGSIEGRIGDPALARELLDRAAVQAARAHAPELELAVWTRVLRGELFLGHFDRVIEWAATGEAAASRAGHEGAEIGGIVGEADRQLGQLDAGRKRLEEALASSDPLREDARAILEMNLGSVVLALGRGVAANIILQRGYDRARHALGEGHPTLAIHLDKLAECARARGRLVQALELHDRSRDTRSRAFGDDDRALATTRFHRAETLLEAGRLDEAIADATAARRIRASAFGETSPRLGELDALLADIALARGKLAEARTLYDRAGEVDPALDGNRRLAGVALGSDFSGSHGDPRGPLDPALVATLVAALGLVPAGSSSAAAGTHSNALADVVQPRRLVREAAVLEPFAVDRVAAISVRLSLLPRDQAAPLLAALLARYRTAGPVDAALSNAVADALLASGDRVNASAIYSAAIAATPDEPSRARLHAFRGLAVSLVGDPARTATASADALATAMPQLASSR